MNRDWKKRVDWIDGYVSRIKPYVRVREADSLLIKIPNQTHKLNPQGLKLLKFLMDGGNAVSVVEKYPPEQREKVSLDMYYFFRDLMAILKGCYSEREERKAVEIKEFALGHNTLPVLSEIAVTYRCNLACRFCYAGCGCRKDEEHTDIPAEKLKDILTIIKEEAEVPSVSFTGGEPLLRPEVPELVRHAKSLGMWANLITNGTLADAATVEKLKEAGLDSAQVSIEAGSAPLHDSIAAHPGAFKLTRRGIENFMKAGLRVHTNTTISALNKDSLEGILDLVKSLGLKKFSMNLLMPVGSAGKNFEDTFISYTEAGPLVDRVRGLADARGLEFMWYSPTPLCIFNPITRGLGNKGCAACDGLLSVAPDGDLLPCSSYPKPLGNILKEKGNFKKLWNGEEFAWFRAKKFAHEECRACRYLAVCNGGCPLYWEKTGYAELLPAALACAAEGRNQ
jgi:radical SAM protein with 4Fe4S-binding SPASM domain